MDSNISYFNRVDAFVKQLRIITPDYLSQHLTGYIYHDMICYRDADKNWFSKEYIAILDDEATNQIGGNQQNKMYLVQNTDMIDSYLYELLKSLDENLCDVPYENDKDEEYLKDKIAEWKELVRRRYNKEEYINVFMWSLLCLEKNDAIRASVEMYARKALNLTSSYNFAEFSMDGMSFEIVDFNNRNVSLKSIHGIWSNFTRYGKHKNIMPNQKSITIPNKIYWFGSFNITEIGRNVFDSLKDTEVIYLPNSIRKIEWSFWQCEKLKRIEVEHTYNNPSFKSINGVLYNGDGTTLCAYPNSYAEIYEIPEGVLTIKSKAFKSCNKIKTLVLPSTLTKIEVNAFYRCENLKQIICNTSKSKLLFEGFWGDYGNVQLNWYFKNDM